MKATIYWILAYCHESYCTHYWEQVARNEWWLRFMTDQLNDD